MESNGSPSVVPGPAAALTWELVRNKFSGSAQISWIRNSGAGTHQSMFKKKSSNDSNVHWSIKITNFKFENQDILFLNKWRPSFFYFTRSWLQIPLSRVRWNLFLSTQTLEGLSEPPKTYAWKNREHTLSRFHSNIFWAPAVRHAYAKWNDLVSLFQE